MCPVDKFPGIAVESVSDSSRYFVLRLQDPSGYSSLLSPASLLPPSIPSLSFLPLSLLSPSSFLPPSIPSLSFLPSPSLLPPSLPPLSFLYFSLPLSLLRLSFFTFSDVHPICSSFFSPFDPFYSPLFDPSLLPFLPVSLSLTSAQLFPLIVLFPSLSSLFFLLL